MKKNIYYYIVALGVFSISLSPIITKFAQSSSIVIAANRMLYTVILLTPFTIRPILKELIQIQKKTIYLNILSGVFLGFHFWSWIDSLQHTTVANSTILVNLHPIFILLISWIFLHERIDKISIISTLVAISGSLLLIYNSLFNLSLNLRGDLMAVIGAVTVAVYLTIGSQIRKSVSTKTYTYVAYLVAFLTLLIISGFVGSNIFSYPKSDILVFLGLAIIPTLMGHSMFSMSMKYLSSHFISMAVLGEPIMATLWAFLIFNESVGIYQFAGGILILSGLAIKMRYQK
jgi:drug/metabolite transporter (DMT)-like permease